MLKTGQIYLKKATANKLLVQSIKIMFLRVFGIVVLFGFTLFLTHHYNPEIIGQYDFMRTFLLVVGSIAILGTDQSILYFSGILRHEKNYSELKKVYNKMLLLILMISLLILLVFLLIGQHRIVTFLNDTAIYPIMLRAVCLLFFYSVTLFNTEVFRALEIVYTAELFRNTFKYLSVIIGAVLLLNIGQEQYLIDTFLVGFVFLSLISTLIIYRFFYRQSGKAGSEKFNYSYGYIIKKSYPIAISTMAIFLLTTLDVTFLKKFYGDKTVAQYGVGVKMMTIVAMVIQMININVSTRIATLFYTKDYQQLQQTLKNSTRMIVAFVLPVIFVVVIFSHEILMVFGSEYVVADKAMKIMILGQGVIALCGAAPVYLNMTGRQGIFQVVLILAVILNFFLNMYLIPLFGIEGAASAFIASMLFWNIVTVYIAYRKDRVKIFLH